MQRMDEGKKHKKVNSTEIRFSRKVNKKTNANLFEIVNKYKCKLKSPNKREGSNCQ